jgi:hypothetical protein
MLAIWVSGMAARRTGRVWVGRTALPRNRRAGSLARCLVPGVNARANLHAATEIVDVLLCFRLCLFERVINDYLRPPKFRSVLGIDVDLKPRAGPRRLLPA